MSADIVMVCGIPFERIIDLAQDQHVDRIIMGMHGRTSLQYVRVGNVTEKVVRLASCPGSTRADTRRYTAARVEGPTISL